MSKKPAKIAHKKAAKKAAKRLAPKKPAAKPKKILVAPFVPFQLAPPLPPKRPDSK